jgi:hypothetical protein
MWGRLPEWISTAEARRRRPLSSFHLHGGTRYDSAVAPALELFIVNTEGRYSLRWLASANETAAQLAERAGWLTERLPLGWAYGGRGVYGPGYSDATGGRHDAVGDALQADPLLGPAHPMLWGEASHGVTNLGWLTMLGPDMIARIGKDADLVGQLRNAGFVVDRVGDCVVVKCGDEPAWSDEVATRMRTAWQAVTGARPADPVLDESWVSGLTLDEMTRWVHRFEGDA